VNGRTFDGGHRRSPGAALEVLKAEAMRRELRRAEGEAYRIVLTPPGTSQRILLSRQGGLFGWAGPQSRRAPLVGGAAVRASRSKSMIFPLNSASEPLFRGAN
jgi:hypothetical protein